MTLDCSPPAASFRFRTVVSQLVFSSSDLAIVPEAPLQETEHGRRPAGQGWFVLNARDALWADRPGWGHEAGLQGEADFAQFGVALYVLGPGEPMAMYHREADQEDFLVLAGEALLVVEGEERQLRQWDFVHCAPGTKQ